MYSDESSPYVGAGDVVPLEPSLSSLTGAGAGWTAGAVGFGGACGGVAGVEGFEGVTGAEGGVYEPPSPPQTAGPGTRTLVSDSRSHTALAQIGSARVSHSSGNEVRETYH